MANMPVINGNQYVNVTTPRVFHIQESIRKNIKVIRRTDLDNTNKYYYQVLFPFMVRWEYWLALQGVNGNFFDTAEGQNGFNNEWFRYANGQVDDWRTYYELTVNLTKNGTPMSYEQLSGFSITDYNVLVGDYIKTFDSSFTTELYNAVSGQRYIQTTDDTGLEAVFVMDSGYQLSGCFIAFHIQTKEGTGVSEFRRYSSVNVQASDTYFASTTGNDLINLSTPTATTLRARCLIDKDTFPANVPIHSISARLYYVDPPLTEYLVYEDSTPIYTEDLDVLAEE